MIFTPTSVKIHILGNKVNNCHNDHDDYGDDEDNDANKKRIKDIKVGFEELEILVNMKNSTINLS